MSISSQTKSTIDLLTKGEQLKHEGKWQDAESIYHQAIKVDQNSYKAYFNLGTTLLKQGKYLESLSSFRKAINLNPKHWNSYHKLADILLTQDHDLEEAIDCYKKAIELNPSSYWSYNNLGKSQEKMGLIAQSIESYQKAIEINPDLIPALSRLSEIYTSRKEYALAFNCYLKLASLESQNKLVFQNLVKISVLYSKLLLKNNYIDEAFFTYQKFISQKLHNNLHEEKIDKICRVLGEAIIVLDLRQGKLSRTITFFQEAINKYPCKEWSYYHLANILVKQGKINKAITCYEKAIKIRPEFYLSLLKLGELLLEKGRINKAFQYGLKIFQGQGCFDNIKENKKILKLLLACSSNPKKSKEALRQLIEQIEASNSNHSLKVNTYNNIGEILRNQNKHLEAIDFYQKSIYQSLQKSKPEFVKSYWNKGKLQEPDFLVVGFAKCGTTSFYNYLFQHPQVLPAAIKEPQYLNWLANRTKNIDKQNWSLPSSAKDLYLAHFAPRPEGHSFITGEASTSNIFPGVEKIISGWFPKIKLIVLLRDPVIRTISHYEHVLRNGNQNASFEKVINSEIEALEGATDLDKKIAERLKANNGRLKNITVSTSLYYYHLYRWMNLFPREQFLILTSENLAQYPEKTMKQAFNFLKIPECNSIEYQPRNVGSYPSVDASMLSHLSDFYQPHNQKLEDYLGMKFNWNYN